MSSSEQLITENVARIREQIAAASLASGRSPASVKLVAVTKYADLSAMAQLLKTGCSDLGESRPQDLWRKAKILEMVPRPIRWHFIGHLQRNKVKRTLPLVTLLHSVDSLRLLEEIQATPMPRPASVLLEVNISGESAKHGFAPAEMPAILDSLPRFPQITVQGLMTMAPLNSTPAAARRSFAQLRELRDQLLPNCPDCATLTELSMGMSGDFSEAIIEGATLVRIGSALFE